MAHNPRTHEAFCTIDRHGCVVTHDSLEDAEAACDAVSGAHLYIGRFTPFRPRRITLRQARALWLGGFLAISVVLDVIVPEYVLFWS